MKMKGIILAGGKGTRLYPNTIAVSKQFLPIYDKPLIYYPLSVLLLARIRDILIISTPGDIPNYRKLLGDGSRLGINIEYAAQEQPRGLADAFIIGKHFIGDDSVCLVLGDNVFFGQHFTETLDSARSQIENGGAVIFVYPVATPTEFGIAQFDENNKVIAIEEKPKEPKSNYAVTGLYFYDNRVVNIAQNIKPSERDEIEITDINNAYLEQGELNVTFMERGMTWFDAGAPKEMLKASEYVHTVQGTQGFYISCIEEIAWRNGYITAEQLLELGRELKMTEYGQYIISLATGKLNCKEGL